MSSLVGARYEDLLDLATGGMARVQLARRVGAAGFDRLVVVKRIHRHLATLDDFRAMLVDEARLSSHVHHPNVVPVVDVIDEGGELALVMDYIESVSLSALLDAARRRKSLLPADVASKIICEVLLGLHAAHEAVDAVGASLAIVHRDVSPQNVLVGTDGTARLIDFGIAKARERVTVTKEDALKGKLRYMSPEQAKREPLDRRSDLFAVGLVLYEALTNRHAIKGSDDASIWIALIGGDLAPTSDLPPPIAHVLERALERDPNDRFATAADFERALRAAVPVASSEAVTASLRAYLGPAIDTRQEAIREARKLVSGVHVPFTLGASASFDAAVVQDAPAVSKAARTVRSVFWMGMAAVVIAVTVGLVVRTITASVDVRPAEVVAHSPSPPSSIAVTLPDSPSSASAAVASSAPVEEPSVVRSAKRPVRAAPSSSAKLRTNPYAPGP